MIDIGSVDLIKFVQKVYDLSQPQGLGHLHFEEGKLSDEEAKEILDEFKKPGHIPSDVILHMDYVKGRACKMVVWTRANGTIYMRDSWFDHTDKQLDELLSEFSITKESVDAKL